MLNGGRRIVKAKRSRKKKKQSSQVETKGTFLKYLTKYIVGGVEIRVGGMKRKLEEQKDEDEDGLTGLVMDSKRTRSSTYLDPSNGGPQSTTMTEPEFSNVIAMNLMDEGIPMGIQNFFYFQ